MILILFSVAIVAGVLGLIKINDNEDDLFTTLKYLGTEFLLLVGTFLIYDLTCDTFQIIDVSEFGYSVQDTALIIPLIFFIAAHLALRPKVRYFYISGSIAVVIMSILLSEPAGNLYLAYQNGTRTEVPKVSPEQGHWLHNGKAAQVMDSAMNNPNIPKTGAHTVSIPEGIGEVIACENGVINTYPATKACVVFDSTGTIKTAYPIR